MVKPQVCDTTAEIRQLLEEDLDRLKSGQQEVRVVRGGRAFTGVIQSYIPRDDESHDEEVRDYLYLETRHNEGYAFRIPEITRVEVLPSQRMTPELGNRQMLQMEAIVDQKKK